MKSWLLVMLLLAVSSLVPAHAQIVTREGIALENQILELRHELQMRQMQGGAAGEPVSAPAPQGSAGPAPAGDLVAQLLDRVSRLEEQVRDLRGRLDQMTNKEQQDNADLSKKAADLDFRLQALEAAKSGPARPAPRPVAAGPRSPARILQDGQAALARHDYAAAEADARLVAAKGGPLAADGQYLLAQTMAGARHWPQAALAYNEAYAHAPKGPRAPDALLGLANSLIALNDKHAACGALVRLHAAFPAPRADLRPSIERAWTRADCH